MTQFIDEGQEYALSTIDQGILEISSTQKAPLGARKTLPDGRVFRYAKAGGVDLIAGELQQAPATCGTTTEQIGMVVSTAAAVGDTTIGLTAVTDAFAANLFQGGYLGIYSGAANIGGGQTYRVKSHTAATAGSTFTATIYDTFAVGVTVVATATICKHPYDSIVEQATTETSMPVGVPLVAVTLANYCWIQTWGMCCVSVGSGAALTVGADVVASNAVAGAVETDDAAKAQCHVGYAITAGAASTFQLVYLRIAS